MNPAGTKTHASAPDVAEGTTTPWAAAAPLVVAAQSGDAPALDELLDLLTPYVGRLCRHIAPGEEADTVQDVLIAVFRGLPKLKDPGSLYAWVRTIAVREAVRAAGRAAREIPVSDCDSLAGARDSTELAGEVHDVLRRLSPEHRAILVLRELEGLDEKAAAELLDVSRGTVKSRLHRARNSFRKAWTR